jgi:hypothetical protein
VPCDYICHVTELTSHCRLDTTVYDEALDDFGTNPGDFM